MYIKGHFCYAYQFGIMTNGLGIVRDITFYNKDFLAAHSDIVTTKKSDSPDEDKSLADAKALIPVLKDFFEKHPLINPTTFLGDAAFDSIEISKYLLQETSIEKAYIPLKNKLKMEGVDYTVNEDGMPCSICTWYFRYRIGIGSKLSLHYAAVKKRALPVFSVLS